MLKHIPFYASLLGRQMEDNKKATNGIVLVYGAVEVHDMGEFGCIASNDTIAKETGLTKGSVAVYLSLMNKSGWIQVNINQDTSQRISIIPLLTIEKPLTPVKPPFNSSLTPPLTPVKHRYTSKDIDNNIVRKEKENKYTSDDIQLTDSLYLTVSKLFPNHKSLVNRKAKAKDYMEINKLHRIDGYDYKTIGDVLKWLYVGYKPNNDRFDWKDVIKSTYKLRKHFIDLSSQFDKDKKTGRYRTHIIGASPENRDNNHTSKPEDDRIKISPEDAEKNRIILKLIRLKKVSFSDMKMLKSKTTEELNQILNPV